MFDGKIVYCKDGDNLIPYWQGVTEEGLEKFVRDYAERGTEGFADFMPNITPHVCRHTYCSNQAKAGMNPKTLQYLMGHSDIGVTMNVYTHLGMEDAAAEMARMEEVESARREQEKLNGVKEGKEKQSRKMFRVV